MLSKKKVIITIKNFEQNFFEYRKSKKKIINMKMNKIEFLNIEKFKDKACKPISKEYVLLSEFFNDYQRYFDSQQNDIITNLELILNNKKTFDEIHDSEVYWCIGSGLGIGYFEVENKTAYFEPDEKLTDAPRIKMPLRELILLLKEWNEFLKN